ncbi:Formylglycine-generating sulphatase enzyme domain [Phytophthora cinnamomi]|uniref:Formylglycine-generating sulphatase enzyme domain n=1 Tax=Phytophthora cinnamomi TaxID=4785 RepID=UPI00355AB46E|nr:Formylglycine-generating sulphatase enzyme domain [Phytophthora cinnamomi]
MLAITSFPRRFPTANKRPLRLARALSSTRDSSTDAAVAAAVTPRPRSPAPSSPLSARPALALAWPAGSRAVHSKAPTSQSSSFATSSAALVRDDDQQQQQQLQHDVYDDSVLLGERADDWFTTARNPRTDPTFPGVDRATGRLRAVRMPDLRACSRQEMLDYLDNAWAMTDALFASLQGERAFMTPPPHQLRHPLIFYYGHPTSFFVNKFLVSGLLREPVNPYFEHIFEVGVDEMRWDDMSKNEMHWPHVADVLAYRRQVYQLVRGVVETHPGLEPGHEQIAEGSPLWALQMALEHERIHHETSSMLMLEHPVEFFQSTSLLPDYHESLAVDDKDVALRPAAGVDFPVNEFLDVPAAKVQIGKPRDFPSFGWDNEYGRREVDVPACRASKFLVSNGEFYDFVRDGGYLEPSFWSEQGWEWRCFRNTKWPAFWVQDGPSGSHRFKLRAMFDVVPMQWSWPAQVNLHEAQAFCKWKQAKQADKKVVYHLTTEPIHQLMRDAKDRSADVASDDILTLPEGTNMAAATGKNLNWSYMSFSPVDALPPTSQGFHDVFGNAWEWCEDMFSALPGFRVHPYYDDFSEPCFDGEHNVIMGGSFASAGDNGASKFARYHFRPHFFQHAGFRVVEQKVDDDGAITLATTDVNAPPPYVNGNPFRSSERVMVSGADTKGESEAAGTSCHGIFEDLRRKSEQALESFVTKSTSDSTSKPLVARDGTVAAAKLRRQVQCGEVLVVVPSDEATPAVLEDKFELLATAEVPVFTQESATEARVTAETVTAWKKIRD